jgi:plastocyanin domain-containing protein
MHCASCVARIERELRRPFTPERRGEYEFTCGMGMPRGKVVAR